MSKGTPSMGKHQTVTHIRCRRCGRHSYHKRHKKCSACGYPLSRLKNQSWKWKPINRAYRKNKPVRHKKVKTTRWGKPAIRP